MNVNKKYTDHNLVEFSTKGGFFLIVNNQHSLYPHYAHAYSIQVQEQYRRKGIYTELARHALKHVHEELGVKGLVYLPVFPALRDPDYIVNRSSDSDIVLSRWNDKYDMETLKSKEGIVYFLNNIYE